ncbi:glycosyltransferase [Streptococcus sanguinis]|jgi:hypothetical protein|uniref:Glycosyltransferase n=2 Tax=Streptococcus sanguinis TaxID=1305 RepID=F2C8D4_STRSA|nr:hypothetical protein [Streptococcus sanguinis]EGF14174.1 hypothetical protein HMPREF9386_1553 [Streptococcus sanguinis SK330]KAF1309102.1 hypothetical protein I925_07865 [Streptococcus sanguinis OH0843]MBZ2041251.1 glycosyltransferase [Streptococcus sanguinis]MCC3170489.1 putative glycosyltransferase [Streptococcus sanguinis]MCY7018158.1 glycosyltransferase [Streptococcus sanguinis]
MNKMKKILTYITLPVFLVILTACGNSSDALQGEWKAQTGAQKNVVLKFDKDKVTVDGKEYDYKQKSVEKKGDITYYKIEQNGENYTVIFPDKDKNIAVMIQPYSSKDDLNGTMLYAMNKKEQPNYSEYSKKYSQ